jgi:hypothetical protein
LVNSHIFEISVMITHAYKVTPPRFLMNIADDFADAFLFLGVNNRAELVLSP